MNTAVIYQVNVEENIDGQIFYHSYPCSTKKIATELFRNEISKINDTKNHFYQFREYNNDYYCFSVTEEKDYFYINDMCDDYYVEITISEELLYIE